MLNRNALLLVAGAAIFALDASVISAQDTTRTRRPTSQRRIPVTKEAHGEVAAPTPPRVDTVTVFKTDTLRLQGRVDTVTTTKTEIKVDTVIQQVPMVFRQFGGLYFGLGAGTSLPYGGIRTVNNPAATGQLQVGWQGVKTALGVRGDVQYSQYSEAAQYAALGAKPDVWNINGDLKLQIPILNHAFGSSVRFSPYLIGGGSYIRYRNLRMQTQEGITTPAGRTALVAGSDAGWHDDFGWNAGGGLSWHIGRKELFLESRLIQFNRGTSSISGVDFESARQIPIVFGVNFF